MLFVGLTCLHWVHIHIPKLMLKAKKNDGANFPRLEAMGYLENWEEESSSDGIFNY